MNLVKEEELFSITLQKEDKFWRGVVIKIVDNIYTCSEFWSLNKDGSTSKVRRSTLKIIAGKNIGKSNETSPTDQAIKEVKATAKKKQDSNYVSTDPNAVANTITSSFLPMLAQSYEAKRLEFPVYLQPKYDGIRAVYKEGVFTSRKGKVFPQECVSHIDLSVDARYLLDGEIMLPIEVSSEFEDTTSALKKYRPNTTPLLVYYVFDCLDLETPDLNFSNRYLLLKSLVKESKNVKVAPTNLVRTVEAIGDYSLTYIQQGFEGSIIRLDKPYEIDKRTYSLMKYKEFMDEEFEIVGVEQGTGNDVGTAVFICKIGDDTFDVRPKGSLDVRREMWQNASSYLGKMLTVKYQSLTAYGKPRFPVGISIRDYE